MTFPGTHLHITERGAGEPILFVHGSLGDGEEDWFGQRALAERYRLLLLDRGGYGESPLPTQPPTFASQATEIARLLGIGMHLVGHSYGGVLAMQAAARRPGAVRSLTMIEPAAYALAPEHPDVRAVVERLGAVYARIPAITPEEFRTRVFAALGLAADSSPLSPRQRKNVAATMAEPPIWTAAVPLDELEDAPFPTLIVSGGWGGPSNSARDVAGRAFDAICDLVERRLSAERAVIRGAGHAVQYLGKPFNERLGAFLATAR